MYEYQIKNVYKKTILDPLAKYILVRLAYCAECSINELSRDCELSPKKILKLLKYLIDKGFIFRRDGYIPSYTGNIYDEIYQYAIIKGN